MLFIGLGLYLLFWCLIRPFNLCRAHARDFFSFIFQDLFGPELVGFGFGFAYGSTWLFISPFDTYRHT
jgi:hypothetical protein